MTEILKPVAWDEWRKFRATLDGPTDCGDLVSLRAWADFHGMDVTYAEQLRDWTRQHADYNGHTPPGNGVSQMISYAVDTGEESDAVESIADYLQGNWGGRECLSIERLTRYTVVITTGGPHVEVSVDVNDTGNVVGGEYFDTDTTDQVYLLTASEALDVYEAFSLDCFE